MLHLLKLIFDTVQAFTAIIRSMELSCAWGMGVGEGGGMSFLYIIFLGISSFQKLKRIEDISGQIW